MAGVPGLVYYPLTKTGNEVWIYYNLGNAAVTKKKTVGSTIVMSSCNQYSCPDGSFTASVLTTPGGPGVFGTAPAYSPIYTAVAGEIAPLDFGVSVDVVCLPDWNDNVLLCYDDSFSETPGMPFRAIPRKFSIADHYVKQRADSTLSIDDKYVSNFNGLRAISGRRVTLIVVVMPSGGGDISEVIYYSNFLCVPQAMNYGNDQNSTITLSGQGSYAIKAIFAAAP